MRIKKNKGSYSASGIIKRDSNQDKSYNGSPTSSSKQRKKNKKKWCKGKVGKKHDLEWRLSRFHQQRYGVPGYVNSVREAVCKNCEKALVSWVTNWELWKLDPNELYNK